MREVRIQRLCPQFHAARRNLLHLLALGQSLAPCIPERICGGCRLSIFLHAMRPLFQNSRVPGLAVSFIRKYVTGKRRRPQDIEVVYLAKQVLRVLEIVLPQFVLHGKKIFDDIAKAFYSNAERVQGDARPVAHCAGVQFARGRPAFERKMLEHAAARANTRRTLRERLAPLPPLFAVELVKSRPGFAFLLTLPAFEDGVQRSRRRGLVGHIQRWF